MKAICNNIKVSIFVYLIVALICTSVFVFVPRGWQSNVDMLRQSVQTKQLLVNNMKAHPQKKVFTVPKEAATWINQLPPDPQVNRALIQIDSLMKQTDVNFQSISLADSKTNDVNTMDPNQMLNEILGKNGQTKQGQQSQSGKQSNSNQNGQQGPQSIPINLSINGSYYSLLDFLYGLVNSGRLIRIDSIQLSHDTSISQQNGLLNPKTLSITQGNGSLSNTNPKPQTQIGTQANGKLNSNQTNSSMNSTTNSLLQTLLTGSLNAQQQGSNSYLTSVTQSTSAVLPLDRTNDKVNVSLVLSIFYMPDAVILGNLPEVPLYSPSSRKNPLAP